MRPTPGELQVYRGASWAMPATDMLQDAVAQGVAVLVVELLEVVDVQHHQGQALGVAGQGLLQQAGKGMTVEDMGQAVQRGSGLCAFELGAQVLDLGLGCPQAIEKTLLLILHLQGALLQLVEDIGQVVDDGFLQGCQALRQAGLIVLAAGDAALYVAFDIVDQFDDLLDILRGLGVCHVHYHHLLGHGQQVRELPALLGSVQQSVLQVHAVQRASQGLFDAAQARQWAERWSQQSQTPFLLALPAYSVALLDEAGRRPLIEAEAPLDSRAPRRELRSEPHAMALLLRQLREQPPPHLQGLIWFRLPLADDRRSWPLATLLAVARGEALPITQEQVPLRGHAIEVRLYAEDTEQDFLPASGTLALYREPATGEGRRVDSGVRQGDAISPFYDPMLAKLIAWGENREEARLRLLSMLDQTSVGGFKTNLAFLQRVLAHPAFAAAELDTGFIARHQEKLLPAVTELPGEFWQLAAEAWLHSEAPRRSHDDYHSPWATSSGWRSGLASETDVHLASGEQRHAFTIQRAFPHRTIAQYGLVGGARQRHQLGVEVIKLHPACVRAVQHTLDALGYLASPTRSRACIATRVHLDRKSVV